MNGSYQLGTAFGIPIRVHWSFLLVVALLWRQPWALVALFGSVLVHELGHSLVARRYGVRVVDITLWPLGGMSRLASMPESPRVEAWVALAGPAVNVLIAGAAACAGLLSVVMLPALAPGFLALFWINAMLGVLNLLPAFPMDGGRVLRAWLARRRDWVSATEIAVRIGRWAATLMLLAPLLSRVLPPGFRQMACILPVTGLFMLLAGVKELVAVRLRHGIGPLGGKAFAGFARAEPAEAERAEPVRDERAAGEPPDEPDGARRPEHWDDGAPGGGRHGWDEAAVEALERFRGRLRRQPPEA